VTRMVVHLEPLIITASLFNIAKRSSFYGSFTETSNFHASLLTGLNLTCQGTLLELGVAYREHCQYHEGDTKE
jgi:hypothetical protein